MPDKSADEVQHNLDVAIDDAEVHRVDRAATLAGEAAAAADQLAHEFRDLCDEVEVLNKNNKTGRRFQRVLAGVCLVLLLTLTAFAGISVQSHDTLVADCHNVNASRQTTINLWHVGVEALVGPNPGPQAIAAEKAFFQKVAQGYPMQNCNAIHWFGI